MPPFQTLTPGPISWTLLPITYHTFEKNRSRPHEITHDLFSLSSLCPQHLKMKQTSIMLYWRNHLRAGEQSDCGGNIRGLHVIEPVVSSICRPPNPFIMDPQVARKPVSTNEKTRLFVFICYAFQPNPASPVWVPWKICSVWRIFASKLPAMHGLLFYI